MICPHAVHPHQGLTRPSCLEGAPATFKSTDARSPEWKGLKWTLQVAPEDCTGCCLCVEVCPAKNKTEAKLKAINMRPQEPIRCTERENYNFFLNLPEFDRRKLKVTQLRQAQVMQPLFEFSGACAGCGETPVPEAPHPALRRPHRRRQRHRLLLHLRRQPAHDALREEQGRPGPDLEQLPVRGQRRVRPGLPRLD